MSTNCWHRLGERCRCGHLTAPAGFYWEAKGDKMVELTQGQAEKAYLEHLKEHMPERYEKLVRYEIPVTKSGVPSHEEIGQTGALVPERGRPRKHKDAAARQKAYRGKHG